jgi:hypothetical protein
MPYAIRKGKGSRPYKLVNKKTGKQVGSSKTKAKAKAAMRARYAHSKGK